MGLWAGLWILVISIACAYSLDIDQISKDLDLRYDVVRNGVLTPYATVTYFANITLINNGQQTIPASGWSIYFCHHTLIQPVYYNVSTNQYIGGGLILSGNITLSHVKGCMFKLDPYTGANKAFVSLPLLPGEVRNISFLASNWAISKYDIFPNWYLGNGTHYRIIQNTADDEPKFVAPHSTFVQFMRGVPNDVMSIPVTPFERYKGINFTDLEDAKFQILPTPLKQSFRRGNVTIDKSWTIDINGKSSLQRLAQYVQNNIKGTKIGRKRKGDNKVINLRIVKAPKSANLEAYKLRVRSKPARVEISGYTNAGIFNGIQSLFSMLAFGGTIPAVSIFDQPRFRHRGVLLDVARNFFPVSTIFKLLDAMALYKLNKLQLNMADDEGWRVEIDGLPELTEIAGRRCHDYSEKICLFSQLGSDPSGNGTGSGFFTKQDYINILKYAADRNIEVVPSINMGGRARAAVISMNDRADNLKSDKFLMHDRDTDNIYLTDTLFDDSAINPCMEGTFTFFDHVLKTLKSYHTTAKNTLKTINIGGDDSPAAAWVNSSYCQKMNFNGPDVFMRIKVYYTTRIAKTAWKHRVNLAGFEEFFVAWPTTDPRGGPLVPFDKNRFPPNMDITSITRNAQNDVFLQRATAFANNGYKVILSQSDFLSLDHAPEADPESPGDYWGIRYIDPLRVFSYLPEHRCCNLIPDEFTFGKMPFAPYGCIDETNCIDILAPENITGMQAQVWTTKIRNEEHLFGLLFPRLIAFAERAWHNASWEKSFRTRQNVNEDYPIPDYAARDADWARFASIIGHREIKRLEAYGINARIPPPGARNVTYVKDNVTKNVLHTDVAYPGLVPQVSGGKNKWADIKPATDITKLNMQTLTFRTRNADNTRYSIDEKFVLERPKNVLERLVDAGLIAAPPGMGAPPAFQTTTTPAPKPKRRSTRKASKRG